MQSEPDVTGHDAELLREITDSHPRLPVKRLAALADRDKSTVYRYLDGQKTIPCAVLKAAFQATRDQRLLRLVSGSVPMLFVPVSDGRDGQSEAIPAIGEMLPGVCDAVERVAASVKHMAAIVADHRIDRRDAVRAAEFRRDANAAIEGLAMTLAALDAHERQALSAGSRMHGG